MPSQDCRTRTSLRASRVEIEFEIWSFSCSFSIPLGSVFSSFIMENERGVSPGIYEFYSGFVYCYMVYCDYALSCNFFLLLSGNKRSKMPSRGCRARTSLEIENEYREEYEIEWESKPFHTRFQSQTRSAAKGTTRYRARIRNLWCAGLLRRRCMLFRRFSHNSLHIEYINTLRTQQ